MAVSRGVLQENSWVGGDVVVSQSLTTTTTTAEEDEFEGELPSTHEEVDESENEDNKFELHPTSRPRLMINNTDLSSGLSVWSSRHDQPIIIIVFNMQTSIKEYNA